MAPLDSLRRLMVRVLVLVVTARNRARSLGSAALSTLKLLCKTP
jgi:hypothetical protein